MYPSWASWTKKLQEDSLEKEIKRRFFDKAGEKSTRQTEQRDWFLPFISSTVFSVRLFLLRVKGLWVTLSDTWHDSEWHLTRAKADADAPLLISWWWVELWLGHQPESGDQLVAWRRMKPRAAVFIRSSSSFAVKAPRSAWPSWLFLPPKPSPEHVVSLSLLATNISKLP